MKVLVSDDSDSMRQWLLYIAKGWTCEPFEASTFDETLEIAEREQPDVILCDLRFKEQNERATVLRTPELVKAAPKAVIIAVSGVADNDTMRQAISAGMHGALNKAEIIDEQSLLNSVMAAAKLVGAGPLLRTITEHLATKAAA